MLVLVDTSVWVDLLGRATTHRIAPSSLAVVATCPPILQEILQGVRQTPVRDRLKDRLLALPRVGDPVTLDLHLKAADIFVAGRNRGLTIRSSADCLIAAIAIENRIPVWHDDRDFEAIARFTDLKTLTDPALDEI